MFLFLFFAEMTQGVWPGSSQGSPSKKKEKGPTGLTDRTTERAGNSASPQLDNQNGQREQRHERGGRLPSSLLSPVTTISFLIRSGSGSLIAHLLHRSWATPKINPPSPLRTTHRSPPMAYASPSLPCLTVPLTNPLADFPLLSTSRPHYPLLPS